MTERVPSSGSCPACLRALGLASVKVRGEWYCCMSCAEGRRPPDRPPAVPEPALYARPRRFFRKRMPRELKRNA